MLFADDVALLSEEIDQAQKVLSKVQTEAERVGLHINTKKTEFMAYKQPDDITIQTTSGKLLKEVQNFKYLDGIWTRFWNKKGFSLVCMQQDEENMEVQHE